MAAFIDTGEERRNRLSGNIAHQVGISSTFIIAEREGNGWSSTIV
jgi:hypothetical protein